MTTYFIATAHKALFEASFPKGSTVIDPWRRLSPQNGVRVRSIGQNSPEKISILLPSRGRPTDFLRMLQSALRTAVHSRQLEIVAYIDDDDPALSDYLMFRDHRLHHLVRPRALLSQCWNECYLHASGEIVMHAGDDIVFRTPGWDHMVREAFAASEDKILFVHGDDLGPHGQTFGTHGFLHRRWVDEIGYFVPPYFSCDWNDVWLNEVAESLGRRVLLPFVTEHMHYTFGKSERDLTHAEREERGAQDDVVSLYKRLEPQRGQDVRRLKAVMA